MKKKKTKKHIESKLQISNPNITMNTNTKNSENNTDDYTEEALQLSAQAFCDFLRKNMEQGFTLEELKEITNISGKIVRHKTQLKNAETKMRQQNLKEKEYYEKHDNNIDNNPKSETATEDSLNSSSSTVSTEIQQPLNITSEITSNSLNYPSQKSFNLSNNQYKRQKKFKKFR